MAEDRTTLLDIAIRNNSDIVVGLIDEASKPYPEFRKGDARTIKGTQYKTRVRTALPDVGFRQANNGVETTKQTVENRLVECFITDASWSIDKAVANASENGPEAVCAEEAESHMEGAIDSVCKQFYYGTASGVTGAAYGHAGLVDSVVSAMEVNASGSGADTSSVWAVKWGVKNTRWVFGKDGCFDEGDIIEQLVAASTGNMWALAQSLQGWLGVQVGNQYSIGRIKNVEAAVDASTQLLTDDLLASLLERFTTNLHFKPDVFYMTPRLQKQLQNSRTATSPTGAPAPFPEEAFGVPIEPTTSILNTETAA